MKINDVVKEAEYADILLALLSEPYQILSVTKLIFISFIVNHEINLASYRNRSKDFVDIFFENISLKLETDYKDIIKIVHVIDMFVKTNKIKVEGDKIELIKKIEHKSENDFLKMCAGKIPNPILEINKLDSLAVIEEVIRYV